MKIRPRDQAMDVTTMVKYALVLMACSAHVAICSSLNRNETDRLSLLEFKKGVNLDPRQAFVSWNDSTHFCHWEGVLCRTKAPRRVISLNLTNQGLVGQISPSLGNLTLLKVLLLPTNSFTGEIPQSLGHLRHLQTIILSDNMLQGRIPNLANCSSLNLLWLDGNNLVGQIPSNLPPLLEELQLSENNLSGVIPISLTNTTTLLIFGCAHNNIEGNIPDEFANFPALQIIFPVGNKLVGSFPQALLNLSTLVELSLSSNGLSGVVPSTFGNYLPHLETLYLAANFLNGNIPGSLTNASKLYFIDVSRNDFTGGVPSSIGKLKRLSGLNLELNNLHGPNNQDWEFMNSLANCTELQKFSVAINNLQGNVPNSFGNHSTQLQYLIMGGNKLSGGFPSGIANLHDLVILELGRNQFTGALPNWVGALRSLQELSVHGNIFEGPIPMTLSNLSHLARLYLGSNQFNGHIPPSFGNIKMLQELLIYNTNIHGAIPKEIYRIPSILIIDLSSNNLSGELPVDIGDARQLIYLLLSSNKLYGQIPSSMGNCESLEQIWLSSNSFNASIPNSLGNITSLQVLNLSHNSLTGTIPMPFSDLQHLQQLDLSFNNLKGELPTKGIFKNATAIHIEGNQALCGGVPELHLIACSAMPLNSIKDKRYIIVLKVVIPSVSVATLVVIYIVFLLRIKRKRSMRKSISLHSFDTKFPKVSYNDLARATDGFSTSYLIGRGRYSVVYKGNLFQDSTDVAIKVFIQETRGAHKSFVTECNALRNVRHRNLVPILTACSSIDATGNDFKALVYKFMPQGDLHALLYSNANEDNTSFSDQITLSQRLNIMVDVADALEYLHHNNDGTIVHCDMKPGNILLDDNMTAHVGDFGLAKFKVDPMEPSSSDFNFNSTTSSVAIKGTIGYIAPCNI